MLDHDGILRFVDLPIEQRKPIFIAIASFTTSYGRSLIVRASQAIRDFSTKKYGVDKYYYSDTDSIHSGLTVDDLNEMQNLGLLHLDDYELGAFAIEVPEFTRAIYIRQKCYIEEIDGKVSVTVAGLPKYLAPIINFDNFKRGFTTANTSYEELVKIALENGANNEEIKKLHHKFNYQYVKGGVILADTDFTIK